MTYSYFSFYIQNVGVNVEYSWSKPQTSYKVYLEYLQNVYFTFM